MTRQEALDLVRRLLRAANEDELTTMVTESLPALDGTFFSTVEAVAIQLEREAKRPQARALRSLGDRMLRIKTLI